MRESSTDIWLAGPSVCLSLFRVSRDLRSLYETRSPFIPLDGREMDGTTCEATKCERSWEGSPALSKSCRCVAVVNCI